MTTSETARLFRLNIEVGDIERAASFYSELLEIEGRPQPGGRCYFRAGPVTLQVVETDESGRRLAAKALYFLTADLDSMHRRAKALGCLSEEPVHGIAGGEPAVRPWGERSFYADDPWGNPLCFVEEGTVYQG